MKTRRWGFGESKREEVGGCAEVAEAQAEEEEEEEEEEVEEERHRVTSPVLLSRWSVADLTSTCRTNAPSCTCPQSLQGDKVKAVSLALGWLGRDSGNMSVRGMQAIALTPKARKRRLGSRNV